MRIAFQLPSSRCCRHYKLTKSWHRIPQHRPKQCSTRIRANIERSSTDGQSELSPPAHVPAASTAGPRVVELPETVLFEGSGALAELIVSLLLAATIIYIPLTITAVGRRFWIKYRFTNKRVSIINTSPLFKGQVDVSYSKVREVRAIGRCFGLWGDMVIILKDGGQLELTAVEDYQSVQKAVTSYIQ